MLSRAGLDTLDASGTDRDDRRRAPGRAPRRAGAGREGARRVRAQRRRLRDPPPGDGRRQPLRRRGHDAPRGDLQGPLLALDAQARSVGADGETTEPLEDFLGRRAGRLLLDVSFEKPAASAFAAIEYPHTHEYTVLAVTGVRTTGGETRLAATGLAGHGTRLRSAEAAASDPEAAGAAAVADVEPRRRRAGLGLVPRADAPGARPSCPRRARGGRMNLTVNGTAHDVESGAARDAPRRPARGARRHEPEGGLRAGRLRRLHRARRRRAAARVPHAGRRARRRERDDRRGARRARVALAAPAGVHAPLRRAVRLLHLRDDARRGRVPEARRHRRPRGDPGGARRPRLPLHRLREDHRRGRRGRARRLVRPDRDRRRARA